MLVLLTIFIQMSFHGRVKAGKWWGRRSESQPGAGGLRVQVPLPALFGDRSSRNMEDKGSRLSFW